MTARASTPFSRLLWMTLGALVGGALATWAATLIGGGDIGDLFTVTIYLLFLTPVLAAIAVVAWAGYQLGSMLGKARRESVGVVAGALLAVVFGAAAIALSDIPFDWFRSGSFLWAFSGALLGAVVVVTLARLPLDRRYTRRNPAAGE
jgi:hypothetical protein